MKTQNDVVQVRKKGNPPRASCFRSKRKHTKSFLFEAKKDTHQRCPFWIVRESFHGGSSFGSAVAALVAGDRLPPMYPRMTMRALGCYIGEAGGKVKNLAINCVKNRKLDDRMVKENNEWERVGGLESCREVSYDPALGR